METVSDPRSEPFDVTRLVAELDQNSHTVRTKKRGANIPLTTSKAQVGETILNLGGFGHVQGSVAHPDLSGHIRSR
jgi:hypothetical protein